MKKAIQHNRNGSGGPRGAKTDTSLSLREAADASGRASAPAPFRSLECMRHFIEVENRDAQAEATTGKLPVLKVLPAASVGGGGSHTSQRTRRIRHPRRAYQRVEKYWNEGNTHLTGHQARLKRELREWKESTLRPVSLIDPAELKAVPWLPTCI